MLSETRRVNSQNPYAVSPPVPPRNGPLFVRSDWWVLALLLLAGPLFGTLAALAPSVGHVPMAAMFGVMFGMPVGVVTMPFVFMLVRGLSPWLVAAGVLAPTAFAAWVGGEIGMRSPAGPLPIAVPLTGLVYFLSAAAVRFAFSGARPEPGACVSCGYRLEGLKGAVCPECGEAIASRAERSEGAEGA
jgi:hypothetical protein